jgi:hypothetical protein
VIFAGARAKNLDPCGVKISGALRDSTRTWCRSTRAPSTSTTRATAGARSTDSDIASFANISVCPNNWSKTNIFGNDYQLEVTVTDRDKRSATVKLRVVPFCAEEEYMSFCTCTCKGGYVLGEACDGAGGAGGGKGTGGNSP